MTAVPIHRDDVDPAELPENTGPERGFYSGILEVAGDTEAANRLAQVQVYPGPTGTIKVAGQLATAQAAVRAAGKDGYNDHHKYKFRSIEGITDAVHTAVAHAGLAVLPTYTIVRAETVEGTNSRGNKVQVEKVVLSATFRLVGEDGSVLVAGPFFGRAEDQQDKAFNKAQTAAFKYFLMQTFTIPSDQADDGDRSGPQSTEDTPQFTDEQVKAAVDTITGIGDLDTLRAFFGDNERGVLTVPVVYEALNARRQQLMAAAEQQAAEPPKDEAKAGAPEAEKAVEKPKRSRQAG